MSMRWIFRRIVGLLSIRCFAISGVVEMGNSVGVGEFPVGVGMMGSREHVSCHISALGYRQAIGCETYFVIVVGWVLLRTAVPWMEHWMVLAVVSVQWFVRFRYWSRGGPRRAVVTSLLSLFVMVPWGM